MISEIFLQRSKYDKIQSNPHRRPGAVPYRRIYDKQSRDQFLLWFGQFYCGSGNGNRI